MAQIRLLPRRCGSKTARADAPDSLRGGGISEKVEAGALNPYGARLAAQKL